MKLHEVQKRQMNKCPFACSYVMWARGEPSALSSLACVAMDTRTGYWMMADCVIQKPSLFKVALGMRRAFK